MPRPVIFDRLNTLIQKAVAGGGLTSGRIGSTLRGCAVYEGFYELLPATSVCSRPITDA